MKSLLVITPDDLTDNRQFENITEAVDRLKRSKVKCEVPRSHQWLSLRTPSQAKLYEPVMDTDGVDVMTKAYQAQPTFELPDFSKKAKIGSDSHWFGNA